MKCEDIQSLVTPYLLGDLDATRSAEVRKHLETCGACRAVAREVEPTLDLLRDALAAPSPAPVKLTETQRARIFCAAPEISAERSRSGAVRQKAGQVVDWFVTARPRLVLQTAAVLVVGGLLAGVLCPSFVKARHTSEANASINKIRVLDGAIEQYKLDHGGQAPKSLDDVGGYVKGSGAFKDVSDFAPDKIGQADQPVAVHRTEKGASVLYGDGSVRWQTTGSDKPQLTPEGSRKNLPAAAAGEPKSATWNFRSATGGGAAVENAESVLSKSKDVWWNESETKPQEPANVKSDLDLVAAVKSPVVMKGIYGSRSPGARGSVVAERRKAGGSADEKTTEAGGAGAGGEVVVKESTVVPGDIVHRRTVVSYGGAAKREVADKLEVKEPDAVDFEVPAELPKVYYGGGTVSGAMKKDAPPAIAASAPGATRTDADPFAAGKTAPATAGPADPFAAQGSSTTHYRYLPAVKSENVPTTPPPAPGVAPEKPAAARPAPVGIPPPAQPARRDRGEDRALDVDGDGFIATAEYQGAPIVSRSYGSKKSVVSVAGGAAVSDPKQEADIKVADGRFRLERSGSDAVSANAAGYSKLGWHDSEASLAAQGRVHEAAAEKEKAAREELIRKGDLWGAQDMERQSGKRKDNITKGREEAADEITVVNLVNAERSVDELKKVTPGRLVYAKPKEDEQTGPRFKAFGVNPLVLAAIQPFSTFSIDVDTASYTVTRNYIQHGKLPPAESVRTEEFVNFFDYGYKASDKATFKTYTECAPSRFGRGMHLLKVGVKGRAVGRDEKRGAVLTFVVDTSGSMNTEDRIILVKKSLRMLVEKLSPNDRVAIIQFGSKARLILDYTAASDKAKILAAIDGMQTGGSTNLEEALRLAYEQAGRAFAGGSINRVLVMSDGAANLGTDAAEDILKQVEQFRKQGVFCSVFGFGIGTYNDVMLETLANKGDGAYAFIDSDAEAQRVFVDELGANLNTIASDVKIQVEFNPRMVKQYRQLGYENRQLKKEQFRDDTVDAGEVGSGQSVTALYEVELVGAGPRGLEGVNDVVATVRVRYRRIDTGAVEEIESPFRAPQVARSFEAMDARFRLAAGVAEFAEILRGSPFAAGSDYAQVAEVLRPVSLDLNLDTRVRELLMMVDQAASLPRAE